MDSKFVGQGTLWKYKEKEGNKEKTQNYSQNV
jgi:hypothetical protein